MIKKYVKDNKGIFMFDCVRFITSDIHNRFTSKDLEGLEDYRIILTHGVIGELINLIEQENFLLPKEKLHLLVNNVETEKLFNNYGYNTYNISEYIFTDDDRYNIINTSVKYDCVFPGREAKTYNLFKAPYSNTLNLLYKSESYPYAREVMTQLFNQAKTGLMTTEAEGSCLSVGEMLSCGLPIVSVKINNLTSKHSYYPLSPNAYKTTYGMVLPNTLGGRELWLTPNNSIYTEREDSKIDQAITDLINKNLDRLEIRKDFLSKLYEHRIRFFYLIKSIFDELQFDFNSITLNEFINLPYGNSTITSTEWKKCLNHFKNSYISI